MLSQINHRLEEKKKEHSATLPLVVLAREIVADAVANGSPGQKAEGKQTIGLHIPETMRLQLLNEKQRWGIKGYRDTVYAALRIGLELLKTSNTVASVPPSSVSPSVSDSEADQAAERLER